MLQGSTRGRTIYYRGYVIQEAGQTTYCSISGLRPGRQELAISETSQEAMRWIDQRVTLSNATVPMDAPSYAHQTSWQFFGASYTPVFG